MPPAPALLLPAAPPGTATIPPVPIGLAPPFTGAAPPPPSVALMPPACVGLPPPGWLDVPALPVTAPLPSSPSSELLLLPLPHAVWQRPSKRTPATAVAARVERDRSFFMMKSQGPDTNMSRGR